MNNPLFERLNKLLKSLDTLDRKFNDYYNRKSNKCIHPGCKTSPVFGLEGKKAIYCNQHKQVNMINVKSNKCIHTGCKTIPTFALEGQKAQYCNQHKQVNMVDVLSKTCIYSGCKTIPNYGKLFSDINHCSSHKTKNDYPRSLVNPICILENCSNMPLYTDIKNNYPLRCEEHHIETDTNIIEQKCIVCGLMSYISEKTCNDCSDFVKNKITRRHYKEHVVKDLLSDHKYNFKHDTIPDQSCNKYRPDFVIDCHTHFIILEVDEHQHSGYQCECEQARMINIHQDIGGGMPVIFIRYNPDSYKDSSNKLIREKNTTMRHTKLIEVLNSTQLHIPDSHLTVIYLFYDGYNSNKIDQFTIHI